MRSGFGRQILVGLAGVLALGAVPEFEVATVKTSPPPAGDLININIGRFSNGKLTFANASMSDCLIVSDEQIAGPDWIKSRAVRFDIVSQTAPGTPREQLELMLQALLADRLKLALHHERKELSFLALVQGKNGAKLRAANPDSAASGNNPASRGHIASKYMSIDIHGITEAARAQAGIAKGPARCAGRRPRGEDSK